MKYYVYILYSQKRQKYYVGQTNNVDSRLFRHNNGSVKSTKSGLPWDLILTLNVESSRSEAMKLERKIKKRGIKRFLIDNQFGV